MLTPSDDVLRALPKAELHVHLDGSLRPRTMLELAGSRGVRMPASEPSALAAHMLVSDARSLEDYLERFELTLAVMQDAEAIERVSYEVVEDHALENVRYVEIRFCPALSTRGGLASHEVIEAMLRGAARAADEHGVRVGTIVCALRTTDPSVSVEMAELAVAYHGKGVVAFDLAGAEAGYPVEEHLDAFRVAHDAALPITVHAGEGFGPPSIRQAIELGHAARLGHGTRLLEDPALLGMVRERGIPLEVCVTSNVQTRVAPTAADHPVRQYFDAGVPVALCTDNRLMSGVTLTHEYGVLRDHLGFTLAELVDVARTGFRHAFVTEDVRAVMLDDFTGAVTTQG